MLKPIEPTTIPEMWQVAEIASKSGLYTQRVGQNTKPLTPEQCFMILARGRELGFGAGSSLEGIGVQRGKTFLSANIIYSAILRYPDAKYDIRVNELTNERCSITVLRNDKEVGPPSVFTMDDAKQAGLLKNNTWKQYARNMLFARALTNAARWYCADVFGAAVYGPGEVEGQDIVQNFPEQVAENLGITDNDSEDRLKKAKALAKGTFPMGRDYDLGVGDLSEGQWKKLVEAVGDLGLTVDEALDGIGIEMWEDYDDTLASLWIEICAVKVDKDAEENLGDS